MSVLVQGLVPHAGIGHPGFDCEFPVGQITLLIGRTGSGKSSLLHSSTGLLSPLAGSVSYQGEALFHKSRSNPVVTRRVGVVFQQPEQQLFASSVAREFSYSLAPLRLASAALRERTARAATDFGVDHLLHHFPLSLSGGQKRRVALASTMATTPDWLFFDEPTAGLDPAMVQDFLAFLAQALQQQEGRGGIVIATHDLDRLLPVAQHVILLADGKVLHEGNPAELCLHPEWWSEAGMGLPGCMVVAEALQLRGQTVVPVPLSAVDMAAAIAKAVRMNPAVRLTNLAASAAGTARPDTLPVAEARVPDQHTAASVALDIRAKWLAYALFCVAVFLQAEWPGLAVSTLIVAVTAQRMSWSFRQLVGWRPLVWLMTLSALVSGLNWSHSATGWWGHTLTFSVGAAVTTGMAVYRVLLLIVASALFTHVASPLQLQEALQTELARSRWLRGLAQALGLGVSLTFRMIPVLQREWQKLSLIVRARAKANVKPGRVRLRDIPVLAIPLTLNILQLGEAVTVALAARGYTEISGGQPCGARQPLHRRDWLVILLAGLFTAGMVCLRHWSP